MRYDAVVQRIKDEFDATEVVQDWSSRQLSISSSHCELKEGNTNMGMFDKDKVFAPDGQLNDKEGGGFANMGDEFILWDCEIKTDDFEFDPNEKPIPMAHLTVAKKMHPDEKKVVSTLSGPICEKVREKEDGDLPAVVRLQSVPASKKEFNDAVVLQFIEPYSKSK
jgi:hypothetical protein